MIELTTFRKNKVDLADYDHSKDVANRLLMAQFSSQDVEILQEILYSSLTIDVAALANTLSIDAKALSPTLERLSQTGLFKVAGKEIRVDKEMRKYYELQLMRFEEDFKPGMDFIQGLLRGVPIHVLPNWYAIPRTSNNIFDSIVEKYLVTPLSFQRYLMELQLSDPIENGIMQTVFQAPLHEMPASHFMQKYNLSQQQFEEHMLYLELNFVCCVRYKKEGAHWKEIVTPFYEWAQYLGFLRNSLPHSIADEEKIARKKSSDFAFVEELSALLELAAKQPLILQRSSEDIVTLAEKSFKVLKKQCPEISQADLHHLISKLIHIEFAEEKGDKLSTTDEGSEWLSKSMFERAIAFYRHPLNHLTREDLPRELVNEKVIREAEKSLNRVLKLGWVYMDDFLKGLFIPLGEHQAIQLKKAGRCWKYQLPNYTEEELELFKAVITGSLFEAGITALGTHDERDCFAVTALGQELFGNE